MIKNSKSFDLINGKIMPSLIIFTIPVMLSGVIQLLFNAADIIVVGKYTGHTALAAVGATSSLISLIINLFMGISVGASVIIGRFYGAKDLEKAKDSIHTALAFAIYGGIILVFVGILLSKPLLMMMSTPDDIIDLSTVYMMIYFVGMPGLMVYNFGSAIMRSIGDAKRPLYYLIISGILNVILNLILVIVFHLGVAGVAIATTVSQYCSALLIILTLLKADDFMHLEFSHLKLHKHIIFEMFRLGIPAGLQGIIFSISNVLIQSSVNSFQSLVVAGNTASSNIEGFVYVSMNSCYQACLTFTSQNLGAKKYDRITKILINSLILVVIVGLFLGVGSYLLGDQILKIYTDDPEVIHYGLNRLSIIGCTYFFCGCMDVFCGSLRGLGYSLLPMFVSLTGACLLRVVWIYTIFKIYNTTFSLYISYPISWFLTALIHFICFMVVYHKKISKAKHCLAI